MNATITPEIASFAQAVRDALHDLSAEERDELTDGLEADLAEQRAEDSRRELPDPGEYATELRNAAGLPRRESEDAGMLAALGVAMRRMRADLAGVVRDNPALAPAGEFAVSVRPVWWVLRAWLAAWLVAAFFGFGSGVFSASLWMTLVLIIFVVVSVQWGRGRWNAQRLAPLVVLGNVAAVLLLLPVVAMASSGSATYAYVNDGPSDLTGLLLDGNQVTNVFPYDADGKPLTDVQLFTDAGEPLRATVEGADGCLDPACNQLGYWVPRALAGGQLARNVFPMAMVPESPVTGEGSGVIAPDVAAEPRPLPFAQAPTLLAPQQAEDEQKVAPPNQ